MIDKRADDPLIERAREVSGDVIEIRKCIAIAVSEALVSLGWKGIGPESAFFVAQDGGQRLSVSVPPASLTPSASLTPFAPDRCPPRSTDVKLEFSASRIGLDEEQLLKLKIDRFLMVYDRLRANKAIDTIEENIGYYDPRIAETVGKIRAELKLIDSSRLRIVVSNPVPSLPVRAPAEPVSHPPPPQEPLRISGRSQG